ncbi:MAG TPA: 1-acyl-sn-glycerol-3-phosphate acyltransferase, partial [Maribacter sp.]|nr:1-acyl-sn-glycerol-3-phosphate acyltransferase [Maribacter sp.]
PMGLGSKVRLEVQQPLENKGNLDELITQIEASVVSGINSFK